MFQIRHRADPPVRRIRTVDARIGVPRSLTFFELRTFFDRLLKAHGVEAVYSPPSGPEILKLGLLESIDEVCLPLKIYFGHVAALVRSGIETVLVPRIISLAKGRNLCPKFHVLPDLVERQFRGVNVVAPYLDLHHSRRASLEDHLFKACKPMLVELDRWSAASKRLMKESWEEENATSNVQERECPDPAKCSVAVLGHLYAEKDDFLGMNVSSILRSQGAAVFHTPSGLEDRPTEIESGIYYEPSFRTARAIEHYLARGIDGIILVTFFACGPDSYSSDTFLYRLKRRKVDVPVMRLIIDEHTSVEGLMTRLVTFLDVARERYRRREAMQC